MLCHNDTVRDLKQENKAKCIIAFGFYSKLEKKRKNKRKEKKMNSSKEKHKNNKKEQLR